MTGIAGIIRLDGRAVNSRDLDAPMRAMASGSNHSVARPGCAAFVCNAHRDAVWPPAVKVHGALTIVADTRLDDREALAARLGLPDDVLARATDADLLLASYNRWGDRCAEHLTGDFAFAIWDEAGQTLFAARDHAGARPFYYAATGGRLCFASEIRGVLAFAGVQPVIDEAEIARFLLSETRGYFDPAHTFFAAVRKLPFGHTLRAGAAGVTVGRYWHPGRLSPIVLPSDADYARRLRTLVESAVDDRLRGVRHAAVHMSGGLDSTSLAALVQRRAGAGGLRVSAISWSPAPEPGLRGAEHDRIDAVTRVHGLVPIYAPARLADRWRFDRDISLWHDQMVEVGTSTMEAAQAAGAAIVVSGWGGDDAASFLGRGIAAGQLARGRWVALARHCRRRAVLTGVPAWRTAWHEALGPWLPAPLRRMRNQRAHPAGPRIVSPDLLRRVGTRMRPPLAWSREPRSGRATMLQHYYDGWMTARIEAWGQFRARHGVTWVYPLLDRRVLEFIYASPEGLHARGGARRALFLASMADLLPADVSWASAKREEGTRAHMARYSNAGDRARILGELEGARQHPWIDLDRVRAALRAASDHEPLPPTIEHALQALVIWRTWCEPVDSAAGSRNDGLA